MSKNKVHYNILFIESGSGIGGSSTCLFNILNHLNKDKFNPWVISYHDGPDIQNIKQLGINVTILGKGAKHKVFCKEKQIHPDYRKNFPQKIKNDLETLLKFIKIDIPVAFQILRIIRRRKVKLLILNNIIYPHIPGIVAATIARIPSICFIREVRNTYKSERIFTKFIDAFVVISKTVEQKYIQDGLPLKKLIRVYDGVDLNIFNPSTDGMKIKKELGISSEKQIVGSVGRLVPGKGYPDFLKAAALVLKTLPRVAFLIIGDDDDPKRNFRRQLEDQAVKLGLNKQVIFTGWRKDIPDILSIINVYVQCSSIPEGLGIANLEAMAMGKPPVVTDSGGLSETTMDQITGFVVPPNDPKALSQAVLKLLNDKELALDIGRNARKYVEENFDIKDSVNKLEQLFTKLLQGK
jgi:glycosyltransferase involved in cell wall biosynthesis